MNTEEGEMNYFMTNLGYKYFKYYDIRDLYHLR